MAEEAYKTLGISAAEMEKDGEKSETPAAAPKSTSSSLTSSFFKSIKEGMGLNHKSKKETLSCALKETKELMTTEKSKVESGSKRKLKARLKEKDEQIGMKDELVKSLTSSLSDYNDNLKSLLSQKDEQALTILTKNQSIVDNDEKIRSLNQVIVDKDKVISEQAEEIRNKDHSMLRKEEEIRTKNLIILDKEEEIREKDQVIRNKDKAISELAQTICNKDHTMLRKEEEIRKKNQLILDKEKKIRGKDQVIRNKDKVICNKDRLMRWSQEESNLKNQLILAKEQKMCRKDQVICEQAETISEKNQLVFDNMKVITEKTQSLRDQAQAIIEKDQVIKEQNEHISSLNQRLRAQDSETHQKDREIGQVDQVIDDKNIQIKAQNVLNTQQNHLLSSQDKLITSVEKIGVQEDLKLSLQIQEPLTMLDLKDELTTTQQPQPIQAKHLDKNHDDLLSKLTKIIIPQDIPAFPTRLVMDNAIMELTEQIKFIQDLREGKIQAIPDRDGMSLNPIFPQPPRSTRSQTHLPKRKISTTSCLLRTSNSHRHYSGH